MWNKVMYYKTLDVMPNSHLINYFALTSSALQTLIVLSWDDE